MSQAAEHRAFRNQATGDVPGASAQAQPTRQAVMHCPYCAEETLFPREEGGWECRSCLRAFSVTFLGLIPGRGSDEEAPVSEVQP